MAAFAVGKELGVTDRVVARRQVGEIRQHGGRTLEQGVIGGQQAFVVRESDIVGHITARDEEGVEKSSALRLLFSARPEELVDYTNTALRFFRRFCRIVIKKYERNEVLLGKYEGGQRLRLL